MLNIGKLYLRTVDHQTRLCADISLNGRGITLWFGVDAAYGEYLCSERSDAFVVAMLSSAMRGGHSIHCETPMSERLHYQLERYLIPSMSAADAHYHSIKIDAPLTNAPLPNKGGVGTGFSGGVDSLYTVMTHHSKSHYPLTHLTVFNVGTFDGPEYQSNYEIACHDAAIVAKELGLELICLDSNANEVLSESFLAVCSFRLLAGALALQGLFSVYLLSSGQSFGDFRIDLSNSDTYDLLIVHCIQTESLAVYCPGGEVRRSKKLEALAAWAPAHRLLHPCFRRRLSAQNCGECKKCIQTMTILYAQGHLDRFASVFDVDAYKKSLSQNIGYLLTMQKNPFYADALNCLRANHIPIPPQAYEEAEALQKRRANNTCTKAEQRDALLALARNLRKSNHHLPKEKQQEELS